jgi:hypothetical protein
MTACGERPVPANDLQPESSFGMVMVAHPTLRTNLTYITLWGSDVAWGTQSPLRQGHCMRSYILLTARMTRARVALGAQDIVVAFYRKISQNGVE